MKTYISVDEYIKSSPKEKQKLLAEVRNIIKKTIPKATETISYGMPSYAYNDEPLFYFASMKGHLGLYPTPGPITENINLLKDYSFSKGCVRVPYTSAIPTKLIKILLKSRVNEIKKLKAK